MFQQLDPATVARRIQERPEAVVLLDVREPYERRLASIAPSLHIPMNEVPHRLGEIPKDREVIVYCHVGARSMVVAGFLEANGFPSVANLSGGIDAWSVKVDRTVPRYG
jgi:rhodanese-related sulfurtransferase